MFLAGLLVGGFLEANLPNTLRLGLPAAPNWGKSEAHISNSTRAGGGDRA